MKEVFVYVHSSNLLVDIAGDGLDPVQEGAGGQEARTGTNNPDVMEAGPERRHPPM